MIHCHYLISVADADLGAPEVNLPVVPGMEMCHWSFRKTSPDNWQKLLTMLLGGKSVKARDAAGWLVDFSGSMDESLKMAWSIVKNGDSVLSRRSLTENSIDDLPTDVENLPDTENSIVKAARKAIYECIASSCSVGLSEALELQSRHSAKFMTSKYCRDGAIGNEYYKTINV